MSEIPTFTPPSPTFTPPAAPRVNGPTCHYHPNSAAVGKCARCGKHICEDCYDTYKVEVGEYAGQALCYDCSRQIVAENVKYLRKNRRSILFTFIFTILGMILGGVFVTNVLQPDVWFWTLLGVMIGGCLWTFVKCWVLRIIGAIRGGGFLMGLLVGLVLGFVIEAVLSIYRTIRKIIESIIYLIKTSSYIKSDANALVQMQEYMEYTVVKDRNVGVDLDTLLSGELQNNSFAHNVATLGEQAAENQVRQAAFSINEHGEVIRGFAA